MTKPDEIHAMVKEAEAKLGSVDIFSSTTPGSSMSRRSRIFRAKIEL